MTTGTKPGKDDVHEQRQENQPGEGMVHDGSPPAPAKPVHPWRRKAAPQQGPSGTRDRVKRPN